MKSSGLETPRRKTRLEKLVWQIEKLALETKSKAILVRILVTIQLVLVIVQVTLLGLSKKGICLSSQMSVTSVHAAPAAPRGGSGGRRWTSRGGRTSGMQPAVRLTPL